MIGAGVAHRAVAERGKLLPISMTRPSSADRFAASMTSGNNTGRVNGWTNHARIYGICTAADGARDPALTAKSVNADRRE